ncbi:hypothetical protein EVAR_74794_1 [Eumeta japonica]|uniref:Uncharacterized protein n=1 Tax=Eumeta variegata TaxID=151549 RepID=A0A4C1SRR2_EUMVA|nr:hypothetical protein EVAR_74794_1 [Eumeta japonica]
MAKVKGLVSLYSSRYQMCTCGFYGRRAFTAHAPYRPAAKAYVITPAQPAEALARYKPYNLKALERERYNSSFLDIDHGVSGAGALRMRSSSSP